MSTLTKTPLTKVKDPIAESTHRLYSRWGEEPVVRVYGQSYEDSEFHEAKYKESKTTSRFRRSAKFIIESIEHLTLVLPTLKHRKIENKKV